MKKPAFAEKHLFMPWLIYRKFECERGRLAVNLLDTGCQPAPSTRLNGA